MTYEQLLNCLNQFQLHEHGSNWLAERLIKEVADMFGAYKEKPMFSLVCERVEGGNIFHSIVKIAIKESINWGDSDPWDFTLSKELYDFMWAYMDVNYL